MHHAARVKPHHMYAFDHGVADLHPGLMDEKPGISQWLGSTREQGSSPDAESDVRAHQPRDGAAFDWPRGGAHQSAGRNWRAQRPWRAIRRHVARSDRRGIGGEDQASGDAAARHDLPDLRAELAHTNDPSRRYIANFNRRPLFGWGGGHHSPIGAFLEAADAVLIIDVNRGVGPWLVSVPQLHRALSARNPFRMDKSRGLARLTLEPRSEG